MTSRWTYLLLAALVAFPGLAAHAQTEARGEALFWRSFPPSEYGLEPNNWAVLQDRRGLIFAGNNQGLGVFDGTDWRTYDVPNFRVRSMALGNDGFVYVGGIDALGRMAPDSLGRLRYESLMTFLPDSLAQIGEVWNTEAHKGGVVFQTRERLMIWREGRFDVLSPNEPISRIFETRGDVFVHLQGGALHRLEEGALRRLPGTGPLATRRLFAVHQLRDGTLLIGTREGRFYRWNRGRLSPTFGALTSALGGARPYASAVLALPDQAVLAIGTIGGGIILADETGAVLDRVALPEEEWVLDLTFDHQGGLWAALYDGLLRIDALASVTRFGDENGLPGIVEHVVRHEGTVYAATSLGVFCLPRQTNGAPRQWEPVLTDAGQAWILDTASGHLLAAMSEGLYDLSYGTPQKILDERAFGMLTVGEGQMYVNLKDGIMLMRAARGQWEAVGRVAGVEGEVFAIGEVDGTLWVSLSNGDILLLDTSTDLLTPEVRLLPKADRPPGRLYFTEIDGTFAAAGESGVFRLHHHAGGASYLAPDGALNAAIEADGQAYLLLDEVGTDLWVAHGRELYVLERTADGYRRQDRPDLPLDDLHVLFFGEDGDAVWIATDEGLLRYDAATPKRYDVPYNALVRSVSQGGRLLFGGAHGQASVTLRQSDAERPVLDFSREEIRFEVAAASYNAPEKVEYQYYLDGFDTGWSAWTTESVRTYTNLPGRSLYAFRVRARNVHGVISEEASYGFRVLPPWYMTWWALAGYVAFFAASVWGASTLRLRKHQRELIRERMSRRRLFRMNEQLEQSIERLAEADALKESLLENASHELRTPLTSILGAAELLSMDLGAHGVELAGSMMVGAERLAQTVKDMMDVANLQAGRFRLNPEQTDVADVVNGVVDAMGGRAACKGLYVKLLPELRAVPAVTDPAAVERVVFHLLLNAVKFTHEGGATLVLDADADTVYLRITDTGEGIPTEQLDHLQRAFTQHSTGHARAQEGSGLGLYIVSMLVEQMGGTLHFEASEGGGTSVSVAWPRYDRRGPTAGLPGTSEGTLSDSLVLLYVAEAAESGETLAPVLKRFCRVRTAVTVHAAKNAARLFPYDGVVIQASEPEARRTRDVLESVPGYDEVPYLLVQGDEDASASHDFFATLHLSTPARTVAQVLAAAMEAYLRVAPDEALDVSEFDASGFDAPEAVPAVGPS